MSHRVVFQSHCSGLRLPHKLEMNRAVALGAALDVPVLGQVGGIGQMPGGCMEVPRMGVEVGGVTKLEVDEGWIQIGRAHV